MTEAKIKDTIIKFCLRDTTEDNFILITEIIDEHYPHMKPDEMMYYISEIQKYPEIILDQFEHNNIAVVQIGIAAKKFIEKGGFTKIETDRKKKEDIELQLAKSNLAANSLNKKMAKQNLKNEKRNRVTTWINIIIGIINIALLLWQIF